MMISRLSLYLSYSLLVVVLLALTGVHVQAMPEFGQKTPIHIEADKMTSVEKTRAVVFSGNVKAIQGELRINSDEMTVYHNEADGTQANAQAPPTIKKMHAKGHVEIIQDDFVATGDAAEYFSETGKVIIIGNAKIIQNNNMVTGYRVEIDLGKGSTVIVPDKKKSGRVVGYFYPGNGDEKNDATDAGNEQVAPEQQKKDTDHGDTGN